MKQPKLIANCPELSEEELKNGYCLEGCGVEEGNFEAAGVATIDLENQKCAYICKDCVIKRPYKWEEYYRELCKIDKTLKPYNEKDWFSKKQLREQKKNRRKRTEQMKGNWERNLISKETGLSKRQQSVKEQKKNAIAGESWRSQLKTK